mmetsp:Transcript_12725/g.32578  ORF Transcript_12725/g.32578 Transcript_12725/m.32578 type:complete len:196 (+) Transcript_12725:64-651(+)
MVFTRAVLAAMAFATIFSHATATRSCGGSFDSTDCTTQCALLTCTGSAFCTGQMEFGYSAFNGYKYCECKSNFVNGTTDTFKYCEDGPTGVGWWILCCCCLACWAGAFLAWQSQQKQNARRAAAAAEHQTPAQPQPEFVYPQAAPPPAYPVDPAAPGMAAQPIYPPQQPAASGYPAAAPPAYEAGAADGSKAPIQ